MAIKLMFVISPDNNFNAKEETPVKEQELIIKEPDGVIQE
jgi:hypothetical protein